MHRLVIRAALPAALFLVLFVPGTASAFPLTGCTMTLTSLDAHGATLGTVTGGAADATQQNPFIVDWDGTVSYKGTTGDQTIKQNDWYVNVWHIPTPLRGSSPNQAGNKDGNGSVGVSANAPFRITGLYYVDGALKGEGGSCAGSGWFKLAGDPVGTIPFFVGLALLIVGGLLAVGAIAGSMVAGLVGGILIGLGAAVMLVIYSVAALGEFTPLAAAGAGVILGVGLGALGRSRGKAKAATG